MSTRSLLSSAAKDGDTQKFKVVLLGDESSGKTSIIRRAVEDKFSREYEATLGVDLFTKTICTPGKKDIRLQVWDTSGQERFKASIPSYVRDCHIAIIAFDVTSREQFGSIEKWVNQVSELREQDELQYIETSGKAGFNIRKMFYSMTTKLIEQSS
eukprot:jgi/Psemu1/296681/fgenesh1_pm.184_\